MSSWDLICEPFIADKIRYSEEFDYFDFVEIFEEKDKDEIDLYFVKTLYEISKRDVALDKNCQYLKKKFKKRNNKQSKFGQEYLEYWDNLYTIQHENNLKRKAREFEEEIQEKIFQKIRNSFDAI